MQDIFGLCVNGRSPSFQCNRTELNELESLDFFVAFFCDETFVCVSWRSKAILSAMLSHTRVCVLAAAAAQNYFHLCTHYIHTLRAYTRILVYCGFFQLYSTATNLLLFPIILYHCMSIVYQG